MFILNSYFFIPNSFLRYTLAMVRLPLSLTRRLTQIFPDAHEREQFVRETLEQALKTHKVTDTNQPLAIGGTLHLFTDGGSRGNPGQAAIGCVLLDPLKNEVLREYGECIGIQTNNIAEYQALITGLKMARQFHPNHLVCHLDSELVVKQITGEYRVKMPTLQPLVDEIHELTMELPDVVFQYIPRSDNWRADALVNKALDER